jgi:hypothetical protein
LIRQCHTSDLEKKFSLYYIPDYQVYLKDHLCLLFFSILSLKRVDNVNFVFIKNKTHLCSQMTHENNYNVNFFLLIEDKIYKLHRSLFFYFYLIELNFLIILIVNTRNKFTYSKFIKIFKRDISLYTTAGIYI